MGVMRCLALLVAALLAPAHAGALVGEQVSAVNANPIRRVVTMLQGMAKKISAEGEKEEELYEKFMCYCKTSGGELAKSISESEAKVPSLQSDIEESTATLKQTKLDLKSHQEDRAAAKSAMASATSQRETQNAKYVAESDELKGYVSSLAGAIPAIMKGMSGAFLQSKAGAKLQKAVANAEQVTDYDKQEVMSFLSGGEESDSEYVPKSGEITGILKTMKDDFEKTLADVESEEAEAVKLYEELMAAKTKQVEALTASIEKKTQSVGNLEVSIVTMKNELTESQAALIEDKKFIANLDKSCSTKTEEMEQRKKTRGEELVAIQETIKILNDDDALELFKKTLPSAASSSLIQFEASSKTLRQKALKLIRGIHRRSGPRPELDLLAMALSGRAVDFTKVIKMIDDMVALLKTEQMDDDHKKEYCEAQFDMVEDKAKELAKKVEDLGAAIEEKEEAISTLTEEIKVLTKGIKKLDKSVADATEQRKEEHEEYVELMSSNNAAKELLGFAKNRLNKFYNPKLYKAPPKAESLLSQSDISFVQIALHRDAPDPPPATWDAYSKKSEETTGVISMIDLLVKDLEKEMTEAEMEEKEAQKDYEEMMSDSASKRAADSKSIAAKETAKADAEETKVAAEEASDAESKELQATKMYEMQLHSECDWLIQNFDLRKSSRTEEMDNLKQAKAVLSGADFSLLQSSVRAPETSTARHLRGLVF